MPGRNQGLSPARRRRFDFDFRLGFLLEGLGLLQQGVPRNIANVLFVHKSPRSVVCVLDQVLVFLDLHQKPSAPRLDLGHDRQDNLLLDLLGSGTQKRRRRRVVGHHGSDSLEVICIVSSHNGKSEVPLVRGVGLDGNDCLSGAGDR